MQVEILKFLLVASAHFSDMRATDTPAAKVDLQAVERPLPDCDWFQMVERDNRASASCAAQLWTPERPALEF